MTIGLRPILLYPIISSGKNKICMAYKYKVSVITICFNAEKDIQRTIESVVNQTFEDFEYIIIDGKSSDETLAIVERYKSKIQQVISEPDDGIYDAMNKGVRLANGEWLIFMNAGDCFADYEVLEKVFADEIPENISFIYSDVYMKQKRDRLLCPMNFSKGALIHQSVIYKKNCHKLYGLYIVTHPIIISDYLFFIRFPEENVMKTNTVIAEYEGGGVSSQGGNWNRKQSLCADVVFRRRSFGNMLITYIAKELADLIAVTLKYKLKSILFK